MRTDIVESRTIERHCWCGSNAAQFLGVFPRDTASLHEALPLVRCEGCGVHAIFPQPSDEALAAAYDRDYYGKPGRKFVGSVSSVVNLFQGGRASRIAK